MKLEIADQYGYPLLRGNTKEGRIVFYYPNANGFDKPELIEGTPYTMSKGKYVVSLFLPSDSRPGSALPYLLNVAEV